jgi:hypothetical protein
MREWFEELETPSRVVKAHKVKQSRAVRISFLSYTATVF